jgi:hypothetical protein
MTDYLREVLKAIRGIVVSDLVSSNFGSLTDPSLTSQERFELLALVQLICVVFDQNGEENKVFETVFNHHQAKGGILGAEGLLDTYKGYLSKSHVKKMHRMGIAHHFHRSGMPKSKFLREVMRVRPEDEAEQRRYLDRALKEYGDSLGGTRPPARLDKSRIKKS